jgi:hypothetical protein
MSKTYISYSSPANLPFEILDANLLPYLLIIVKPLAFLQVDAGEDCGRVQALRKPLPLSKNISWCLNAFEASNILYLHPP